MRFITGSLIRLSTWWHYNERDN